MNLSNEAHYGIFVSGLLIAQNSNKTVAIPIIVGVRLPFYPSTRNAQYNFQLGSTTRIQLKFIIVLLIGRISLIIYLVY